MNENSRKRAIIIHGWESSPEAHWLPWLKRELEARDYLVEAPAMPNPKFPKRDEWVSTLRDLMPDPNEDTVLIGHSLGCIAILQYAASLKEGQQIGKVILVAGFIQALNTPATDNFFVPSLDCTAVKRHISEIVSIHSDNDPYISSEEFQHLADQLDAQTVLMPGARHISTSSGIKELPQILPFL